MAQLVDVVYDTNGAIVALGFPPASTGNIPQASGPGDHPGLSTATLELPDGATLGAGLAAALRVQTTETGRPTLTHQH